MENVNTDVKEYTRVKKNGVVLFRFSKFIELDELQKLLRKRNIIGKFEIEYILKDANSLVTCALFFYHGTLKVGAVFPYANYRNNTI